MAQPKSIPPLETTSILYRAHSILGLCGILYGIIIASLFVPFIQTHVLYLHSLKFPLFAKYDIPERYGIAPGKAANLRIQTSDNVSIGAWFVLSDSYYQSIYPPESYELPTRDDLLSTHISKALASRPTILFLHGNAATRAVLPRVEYYKAFTRRLDVNVLAIDYRGFGDSDGTPSEDGLAKDARAAWDWVISMKQQGSSSGTADPALGDDILIVGHSLGTAVSARLAAELSAEGVKYRGVALLAPFESIETLLSEYHFFGLIPLMKPIHMIPGAAKLLKWGLVHKFDTAAILTDIKEPILIAHAENDWDIPYTHAVNLFEALLDPHLPAIPEVPLGPSSWTNEDWDAFRQEKAFRLKTRQELVTTYSIPNIGTVEQFDRAGSKGVFLKAHYGWHDQIPLQEGVQDVIRRVFRL